MLTGKTHPPARIFALVMAALAALLINPAQAEQKFPDVVSVQVHPRPNDRFDFDVTISSPYDTPARYADGIRALDEHGTVLGTRKLWHDHADEQPFTRDMYGVDIPAEVHRVIIQARDQQNGWGGSTVTVPLPNR